MSPLEPIRNRVTDDWHRRRDAFIVNLFTAASIGLIFFTVYTGLIIPRYEAAYGTNTAVPTLLLQLGLVVIGAIIGFSLALITFRPWQKSAPRPTPTAVPHHPPMPTAPLRRPALAPRPVYQHTRHPLREDEVTS
ncbi:MAG: hypothetical protein KDD89_06495 [Anaerolineales bacterium]|nr:hypothetical protein [Anaerolineales bacterium]